MLKKLLLCSVVFACVCSCQALYEDQIGKFDWKKELIGGVKFSDVDFKNPDKRVFVGTEENVVAALSFQTGEIVWRHVLDRGSRGCIKFLKFFNDEIVTVTGSDTVVIRRWDASSGYLVRQINPDLSDSSVNNVLWFIHDGLLYCSIVVSSSEIRIRKIEFKTGKLVGEVTSVPVPGVEPNDRCVYSEGAIACIDKRGKMTVIVLKDLKVSSRQVISDGSEESTDLTISAVYGDHFTSFTVGSDYEKRLIGLIKGEIRILYDIPVSGDVYMHPVSFGTDTLLLMVEPTNKTELITKGIVLETKATIASLSSKYYMPNSIGSVKIKTASCYGESSNVKCALVISSEDHVLTLLDTPGKVRWTREEALSNILSVEMIELPMSETEAFIQTEFDDKDSNILRMFIRRISTQLQQLHQAFLTVLGILEGLDNKQNTTLVRDQFNLHKIIIAATYVGKVFAIDNINRQILWSCYVSNVEPFSPQDSPNIPMYMQRTARHSPHPPQMTILLRDKKTGNSVLYSFDPISGDLIEEKRLNFKVIQAMLAPTKDEDHLSPLMLVDSSHSVYVYPEKGIHLVQKMRSVLYFFVANSATGDIVGLAFDPNIPESTNLVQLWNMNCGGKIIKVASKSSLDRVHSQGRVLADRSVLYKYVNPNLVAIVAETKDVKDGKPILLFYLLDSITGAVLYSDAHHRATHPAQLVHSENWIALFYFSEKYKRSEVATYELFEGLSQSNSTVFSSIETKVTTPFVDSQSYVIPVPHIEAAKETITEKGITSKHILLGLASGHVLELPWAYLDPRRPSSVSQEMREEGIIPYTPEIPVLTERMINYNQTLNRIAGIYTVPSNLESTCLVFVYGLDLYYTRVAPSKTFDLLKDDFDYYLIVLVLAGLVALTFITKHFAHSKALHQTWK